MAIQDARQSDDGRYQCIARNAAGVRESSVAFLKVHGKLEHTNYGDAMAGIKLMPKKRNRVAIFIRCELALIRVCLL